MRWIMATMVLGLMLVARAAWAQDAFAGLARDAAHEANDIPEFDKMRTPDSPAFAILGVAPSVVQRPNTPRALALALSSFVDEGDVVVPSGVAIEVAPYWLVDHPRLTMADYAHGASSLYQLLTFSLATTSSSRDVTDPLSGAAVPETTTSLAAGVRTRLFDGGTDNGCIVQVDRALANELAPSAEEVQEFDNTCHHDRKCNEDKLKKWADDKVKAVVKSPEYQEAASTCLSVQRATHGLVLDFAGAARWDIVEVGPGAQADMANAKFHQLAGWLTGGYVADRFSVIGLLRTTGEKQDGDWHALFDGGASGVVAIDRFAASVELVWHGKLESGEWSNSYRVALVAEGEIGEGKWLNVSFGKDFDDSTAGSFFSLVNLSWSIGKAQIPQTR